ncbi:MAG: DUF4238 domain-containing protein [Mesorhizobium sp.]|nr:MAG: DUF4238 domain-containing protein [Mesorhizobium sp.]
MEYKNNHYVARMLLKRFMSDDGEFFYVDRRRPEKAIIHRNPEGVFSRNHLYTSYDKDGNPDVALERDIYRKIESDTSPIIDKIVSLRGTESIPNLARPKSEYGMSSLPTSCNAHPTSIGSCRS